MELHHHYHHHQCRPSLSSIKRDFIKFYEIALKSANETKYWICLLRDGMGLNNIDDLLKEADEISKVLATIIINTKKSK